MESNRARQDAQVAALYESFRADPFGQIFYEGELSSFGLNEEQIE